MMPDELERLVHQLWDTTRRLREVPPPSLRPHQESIEEAWRDLDATIMAVIAHGGADRVI
jgi:hypothetical protein